MRRAVAVVVLVLSACASGGGGSRGPDAGAELACTHFRNVADDAAAGILTTSELRGKLQEVYEDASVSEETGIAAQAQRMLAAITEGDMDRFDSAVTAFSNACERLGL